MKIFINHTQCFQQYAEFCQHLSKLWDCPELEAQPVLHHQGRLSFFLNSWHNWWEIKLHIYGAVVCGLNLKLFFFLNKLLRSVPKTSDFTLMQKQACFSEGHPQDLKFFFSLLHFDMNGRESKLITINSTITSSSKGWLIKPVNPIQLKFRSSLSLFFPPQGPKYLITFKHLLCLHSV